MEQRKARKWTSQENAVLLRYIKADPRNLHKCFTLVSEHLTDAGMPRTVAGVASHWYTVLSKREDPEALCFFTASSKHISKNRKNGAGIENTPTIWRRLCMALRSLTSRA